MYAVGGHEVGGKASKLSPDLGLALTPKFRELHISLHQANIGRLEDILARMREAQNFSF